MRLIFGLVLIVGLGLAGFATYMAKNYIDQYQQQLAQERAQRGPALETVNVIIAKRALKFGEKLTKDDVAMVPYPKAALPEGIFTTPESLFPENARGLREVLRAMDPMEAILASKVTAPGEAAGISSRLEVGTRAFAIQVDASSGVSGFLRPGDMVDVYWTGRISNANLRTEGDSSGDVTKLIESQLPLIAVDQSADLDRIETRVARTVTVAATPQQVAALAQAQSTGRLSLSLVGVTDTTVAEVIEVDQTRLLGIQVRNAIAPEQEAERCVIRSRRGAEVVITEIPCTN
ncbi:Flp pilus assembly protein CpaB [Roseovarius autotrophicus]|uniref:Flp pilus assembly protein CpaB n=1 Tax=Roseovarius autotrophicus TaxID=2824121 RepID=UPI0019ED16CD|nr:Flp pilus assembly protein CpaB [Roseovarius autotrophicus]MBE0453817.1 Flp pilus assembly protein CpaB [Roseovarius sp.]